MIRLSQSSKNVIVALLVSWATAGLAWAASPTDQTFDIKISHGRVANDMYVIRVKQGDRVRLRLTSAEPMVLHLHGYDIEKELKPGIATEFAFEAYAAGRFPVNTHSEDSHEATLLYVEVHPR